MFWERDEWPSLRSSGSLSIPSLCSLLTWPPFIFDLSRSSLVLVFYASSSSSFHFYFIIFIPPLIPFLQWPHFRVRYPLRTIIIHLVMSSIFLHCIIIVTMFTVGIFRSMAHDIFYTCCILYMRAWVLIIGYLGLVSLHFYHPIALAFVTSWVLRPPWGHDITHYVW